MDKIIANLPKELGYRMGNDPIHIICYADEAVLIADSEENLQILLLRFDQMAERLNMEISLNKTKFLTISRNYTKCEVQLKGTSIKKKSQSLITWGLRYRLNSLHPTTPPNNRDENYKCNTRKDA